MTMEKRIVFLTGATSGIGAATARALAAGPFRLVLCGRRQDRLEGIRNELAAMTEIHCLSFDVRDKAAVEDAVSSLPADWRDIDVLINNAGNAHGLAPIHEGDTSDWEAMMDINVKGLLYVSRAILPGMAQRNRGHIINIGSIAGKEVYPNGNIYCASKFAVDAITDSMRLDLNKHRIKVTGIHPGLVRTEFASVRFKGDQQRAEQVYRGMQPLSGEDIADLILFILERPAHVQIADLVVFPTAQASSTQVLREG